MDTRNGPTIGATVRRSHQLGKGGWLTVELTASRSVYNLDPDADAVDAQNLAAQLDRAVIDLMLRHVAGDAVRALIELDDDAPDIPAPPAGDAPDETMECPTHGGAGMRIRWRDDGTYFYSHNDVETGGRWCNYQPRSS